MNEKPKILIVDDRHANLLALKKLLSGFDADIYMARSGQEALSMTFEHDFALAILDVQMPDMDGFETLELLRQSKETRYLPVIFVSAIYKEEEYVLKGIKHGAVDFISKPIQPQILKGKVQVFLELYSQRKKVEELLEKQKKVSMELERLKEDETLARKKAEEATKSKSRFLANMSHEIRTPLNGIIGMADIMKDTPLNTEQQEYLETISSSGDNLLSIINDVLDFSKIESGQLSLEKHPFALRKEIESVIKMLSIKSSNKNIELRKSVSEDIPTYISGDSTRIRQIITNLVGNALKFTQQGFVEIRATIKERQKEQLSLLIEVEDSGIGIKEENQRLLFNEFAQAENNITRKYGGTGLGLAISKMLAETMNGNIGVKSTFGKGSTFWFTVKVNEVSTAEAEQKKTKAPEEKKGKRDIKILLAEDNPVNQKVAKIIFGEKGVDVTVAENGKEAVEMFVSGEFHMVVTDLMMPEMDGFEATRKIREIEKKNQWKAVPVVAMSASITPEIRQKCREAGMDAFLGKPVKGDELNKILDLVS